jgi:hypothetical protein
MRLLFFFFVFSIYGSFISDSSNEDTVVTYKESFEDFPNPERGFYQALGTKASKYELLSVEKISALRRPHGTRGANYQVVSSLVFREFLLDSFVHSPLSGKFLENVRKDFQTIRLAGLKSIIRFAYTNTVRSGDCPDKYKICPPYGDAPKNIVLKHISQLKPILFENVDVIATVQMGFIGIWGENYFTDYFGDASSNGIGRIMDSSWRDRNEILKALLDAVPKDRMIQVRTPQIKQRFVYGEKSPVTSPPLKISEAYNGSDKSRIGFHNDCFLSSADDYGTFYDYGNSSTSRGPANVQLRTYASKDSRYVVMGGETCDDAFSPQNDCEPAGRAEKEFFEMHYSYLNTSYNLDVNNDWESGGCMASIRRKLGYRLVLQSASFPNTIQAGKEFHARINLKNIGYASPYNPRPVELILRRMSDGKILSFNFKTDLRYWVTGKIVIDGVFFLPANTPIDNYELLLNLPDENRLLAERAEYSIRLANEKCWEEQTGFNKLGFTLMVIGAEGQHTKGEK